MAHGEFIAMGGYVTTYSYHAGAPLALAMLIGAVACGLFGVFPSAPSCAASTTGRSIRWSRLGALASS
jgi:branched-subunit amino acid ABC-type transport system permease component